MFENLQLLELCRRRCTVPRNLAPSTRDRVHV